MTLARAARFSDARAFLASAQASHGRAARGLHLAWCAECERLATEALASHESAEQRARTLARAIKKRALASEVWEAALLAERASEELLAL
jgi:hypothetical protein